jgi:hypothetical protein
VVDQRNIIITADFEASDNSSHQQEPIETDSYAMTEEMNIPKKLSLIQMTQVFSTWHYFQTPPPSRIQGPSDFEVQVSRVEYQIAQLERDLKDPNCHRDIDDMQQELKSAKDELSRLKWKRWLGRSV